MRPSLIAIVVVAVVAATAVRLVRDFPQQNEYSQADESTYLQQGIAVRDGGIAAFSKMGREYIADPTRQAYPSPSRVGSLAAAAIAVRFAPSLRSLSILSTASFALLGLATFAWGRRIWGEPTAALAVVLLMVSPLDAGMARRALMDGHLALFLGVALLAFISWLHTGSRRDFAWFAAAAVWAMLVKETAFFFMPFFLAAAVALKWRGESTVTTRDVGVIAVLPIMAAIVIIALMGGFDTTIGVVRAMRAQAFVPGSYIAVNGSGPWHEYLVDHLLISPVSLLFFGWCGSWLLSREPARSSTLLIAFFWWGIACLSLFPKNPRFAMALDLPLRLGAAVFTVELIRRLPMDGPRRWAWRAGAAAALAAIVVVDLATYQRMFITWRMYDPVAANLIALEGMAPPLPPSAPAAAAATTPEALLDQSTQAYQRKDFAASIRYAEAAVALKDDFAEAYNNIGAAHCELQQWREAVVALQRAVALKPDYQLARNNLAWAMSSLK